MDALAVIFSTEFALWGIETHDHGPGRLHQGHQSLRALGQACRRARVAEYEAGPYAGIADKALKGLASLEPADAPIRRKWLGRSCGSCPAQWTTPPACGMRRRER
jgi:hypothetical protein